MYFKIIYLAIINLIVEIENKMKCYLHSCTLVVIFILLIVMCKQVVSLKCYQCSTLKHAGCFSYALNKDYLKECPKTRGGSKLNPICRAITQMQFFTPDQDLVVMRECAYVYREPLKCEKSKFSMIHISESCECDQEGCNAAYRHRIRWKLPLLLTSCVLMIK